MKQWMIGTAVVLLAGIAGSAHAQETVGPGRFELSVIPVGGTWTSSKDTNPNFHSYDARGTLAYNFTRVVGVEAEVTGSFGLNASFAMNA
jgi:hypothetical protein